MKSSNLEWLEEVAKEAKKQGADFAEVKLAEGEDKSVNIRLGELEYISSSTTKSYGLRVIIGKRQASVLSNDFSTKMMKDMVSQAVAIARLVPEDGFLVLPVDKPQNVPTLDLLDDASPPIEELISLASTCEESARKVPLIANSEGAYAAVNKSTSAILLANGFAAEQSYSYYQIGASVVAKDGDNMEIEGDSSTARFFEDLVDPAKLGSRIGEKAAKRLGARKIASGEYSIIFPPKIAKSILSSLLASINGDKISKGISLLLNKLHKQVFSSDITIYDDPFLPRGLGSQSFDSEGQIGKKLAIVENGVLNSWLLDLRSAHKLGMKTTAHASSGLASASTPSSTNTYFAPGKVTPEEMLSSVQKGIIVTDLSGFGINLVNGNYSQGAFGFLVENGQIKHPVNEITIASNLLDMWQNLILANDLEFRYATNSPTMLIPKMIISGK